MKKVVMASAVVAVLGASAGVAQAANIDIVWSDNITPDTSYPATAIIPNTSTTYDRAFRPSTELRMISPAVRGLGIGSSFIANGMKNVVNGGETWSFMNGSLMEVSGTGVTPDGDVGAFQNAPYVTQPFGFAAPFEGSRVGDKYGVASIDITDGVDEFSMYFPVLEAQWSGFVFPLGKEGDLGVTFNCNGAISGNINCYGEHRIIATEDPGVGFRNFTAQWELHGTLTQSEVPVPAAVWLFGSGLIGLVGLARKSKRA